jgi:hypothetical protein
VIGPLTVACEPRICLEDDLGGGQRVPLIAFVFHIDEARWQDNLFGVLEGLGLRAELLELSSDR